MSEYLQMPTHAFNDTLHGSDVPLRPGCDPVYAMPQTRLLVPLRFLRETLSKSGTDLAYGGPRWVSAPAASTTTAEELLKSPSTGIIYCCACCAMSSTGTDFGPWRTA
eukprot:2793711-Rhodomonas_salina.3